MNRGEKVDLKVGKVTSYFAAALAGWLACSTYYGTLHLKHVETVELPKAVTAAKCEDLRADRASVVAGQAIVGAVVDGARIPSPAEIPKDNCPHPAAPPPPAAN